MSVVEVTVTNRDKSFRNGGLVITALWLIAATIYIGHEWTHILELRPDGFATFLGGVFAPLAFLWLVLGYFQQGEELRHSVEALRLQAVELSNSVEQQRELVSATREQIDHERNVALANEKSANLAARPLFRIIAMGQPEFHDGRVARRIYTIQNFGNACRDVTITRTGHHPLQYPHFDHTEKLNIAVEHPLNLYTPEYVTIDYRDNRNQAGRAVFVISAEDIGYIGITAGEAHQLYEGDEQE